ncbi:MAG TPA: hypothetical protein ENL16_01580 [Candidatus Woesearchaeota archaeon]|nr:hypothetical protein [Candidatus Woesearchaeota archaeon]
MPFINATSQVGVLMSHAVNNIFGSWYVFGFVTFLLVMVVALALRINFVWVLLLLIPVNLVFLAYGIIPLYLGGIFMLVLAFLVAFSFGGFFRGFT